mgnify:CR=1 FL=1|jgi:predicted DNA-binding transcriptional regulator AlpA
MADERNNIEPRCLSLRESAKYVGVSVGTFSKMVKAGQAPQAIRITERRLVWDKRQLDGLIDNLAKR